MIFEKKLLNPKCVFGLYIQNCINHLYFLEDIREKDKILQNICPHVKYSFFFLDCNPYAANVQNMVKMFMYTLVQGLRFCTGCTAHRGSKGIAVLYRH